MPQAYDGVYELRIWYDVPATGQPTLTHRFTIDVKLASQVTPGTLFSQITTVWWDTGTSNLETDVETLVGLLKAVFHSSVTFTHAELWKYPTTGTNAAWIASHALNVVGTAGSSTVLAHQATMTFRTAGGSIMRVQLMEMVVDGNGQDAYPVSNAGLNTIMTYIYEGTHPFQARDDTQPLIPLRLSLGQNEALWRKRFRP